MCGCPGARTGTLFASMSLADSKYKGGGGGGKQQRKGDCICHRRRQPPAETCTTAVGTAVYHGRRDVLRRGNAFLAELPMVQGRQSEKEPSALDSGSLLFCMCPNHSLGVQRERAWPRMPPTVCQGSAAPRRAIPRAPSLPCPLVLARGDKGTRTGSRGHERSRKEGRTSDASHSASNQGSSPVPPKRSPRPALCRSQHSGLLIFPNHLTLLPLLFLC